MKSTNVNEAYTRYQYLIKSAIKCNRRLLAALRLEDDDVAQDLAIKMLSAIRKFDPARSKSMEGFLYSQLQYEILDMKRRHKPHGMTGVKPGATPEYVCVDKVSESNTVFEIPSSDGNIVDISDFLESLTAEERETLNRRIKGYSLRGERRTAVISGIRDKFSRYYAVEDYSEGRKCA